VSGALLRDRMTVDMALLVGSSSRRTHSEGVAFRRGSVTESVYCSVGTASVGDRDKAYDDSIVVKLFMFICLLYFVAQFGSYLQRRSNCEKRQKEACKAEKVE
jgi:hypothetical protein